MCRLACDKYKNLMYWPNLFVCYKHINFYEYKFYERINLGHNGLRDGVIAIKQKYAQIVIVLKLITYDSILNITQTSYLTKKT